MHGYTELVSFENRADADELASQTFALLNELANKLGLPAGTSMPDVVRYVTKNCDLANHADQLKCDHIWEQVGELKTCQKCNLKHRYNPA